jgi:type II secretory pathway pseudopilin PulG
MFSKKKAFSFLELLLVLAVLMVILSLGVFSFQKLTGVTEQKIFFNQLLYDMDAMRDLSRLDHQDRQIDFWSERYEIKIASQIVKTKHYPKSLTVKSIQTFAFASSGIPKKSGTVSFWNQHNQNFLIILAPVTGRVRLEVP